MIKFIGQILILGAVFWGGYYVGQQPPGEVQHQLETFSEDVVEKAFGLDQSQWDLRREALEAKARFLDSREAMLEGDYDEAAEELDKALLHVKNAVRFKTDDPQDMVPPELVSQVEDIQETMQSGEEVSRDKLDAAQEKIDRWLQH
jgi:hypothetical protein